ncbi:MAG: transposase [Cyanothece sp. SIO2G6]|nr:transposase [Cyanothece sp. SIO2G6]
MKGSNRWKRTQHRIAKLHLKIANIRNEFLHKLSTRLVMENQLISLEDLNVKGMVKNRTLARAISLQGGASSGPCVQRSVRCWPVSSRSLVAGNRPVRSVRVVAIGRRNSTFREER